MARALMVGGGAPSLDMRDSGDKVSPTARANGEERVRATVYDDPVL